MSERSKVAEYMDIAQSVSDELYRVTRQRDALLDALKMLVDRDFTYVGAYAEGISYDDIKAARAAITEAEGTPAPETKV